MVVTLSVKKLTAASLLGQIKSLCGRWPMSIYESLGKRCLKEIGFVGCLTSQQLASVSRGRICSDNFTCCHTEREVVDQTYLTQLQYTDTGPTSPSADPYNSRRLAGLVTGVPMFWVSGMIRPQKKSRRKQDSNPGFSALEADALTTRPKSVQGNGRRQRK